MATGKPSPAKNMLSFWRSIVFLTTPVILCPLPIYYASTENSKIAAGAYAVIIMAVYWATEVLPLAVTALLPIVLFPVLGVQSSNHVCINYFNDSNMLTVGGLLLAVAIERWNLHKRIALRAILTVGVEPRWLMLGIMSVTAFLSMWISNTATTAMMVPIAQAILTELLKEKGMKPEGQVEDKKQNRIMPLDENTGLLSTTTSKNEQIQALPLKNIAMEKSDHDDDEAELIADQVRPSVEQADKKAKGLLLCICYAANIGGTATLIGTPPNIIAAQTAQTLFPKSPGIDFVSWFCFAFPTMVVALLLAWLWLQRQFLDYSCVPSCISRRGCSTRRNQNTAAYEVVRRQYDELGPFSFAELVVLSHFAVLVLLWFFRDMAFIHLENGRAAGWTYFFVQGYVTDSSAVFLIALALFVWPSRPPSFLCRRGNKDLRPSEPAPPILDWSAVEEKLPWEVVILLGGGFALADGVKVSGLSEWLAQGFRGMDGFPPLVIVFIVTVMIAFTTEFSSNTSTAAIFLPILGTLAQAICVHPYYLMVPATIASSFAFMLPVATPPNAIVFSYGRIKAFDMAKSGFVLNLVCLLVLNVAINTYGIPLYNLHQFPPWTTGTCNVTTAGPSVTPANITTPTLLTNGTR
ncbi:solute carrier family 13 member 5-like isoform X2 [Branchiostoma floridae]|uniref:Solute carrier family 13 member 5-like isoform X1 n=1 Tax=Branchiostoma floridae TaxID=7739 RepID=A0A9J7LYC9_BRAFL|nr:solute carrier family 13 member 5-like isoform X1 [Branchiostoma floridae]XP_035691019.1 solute carrier family 13 member 5-like isoform X2 [Branchiostoma floridae]